MSIRFGLYLMALRGFIDHNMFEFQSCSYATARLYASTSSSIQYKHCDTGITAGDKTWPSTAHQNCICALTDLTVFSFT